MNTTVTKRTKPSFYHIVGVALRISPNMLLTHFFSLSACIILFKLIEETVNFVRELAQLVLTAQ